MAPAEQEVVVERGEEVQARVAEQTALLTGQADPESVPVDEGTGSSDAALLPDPAAPAGRRLLAALVAPRLLAGRRLLAFRFRLPSSKPATRPSGPAPTGGSAGRGAAAKPLRPYFPAGGTARPRYSGPAAAVSRLPFAAAQRPYLASRFYYGRPVYGFGRWAACLACGLVCRASSLVCGDRSELLSL